LVGLVLFAGGLLAAEELKGKVKSYDAEAMTITVTAEDGQDHVVHLSKEVKVVGPNGKIQQEGLASKRLKAGTPVTVTYETGEGGKKQAVEVRMGSKEKKN
jgi:hypothetical protein